MLDRLLERIPKEYLTTEAAPRLPRWEASIRDDLHVDLRLGTSATALHTGERRLAAGGRRSATPARSSPPMRRPVSYPVCHAWRM